MPFIVTLGTMLLIRGAAKGLADERRIEAPITWLNDLLRTAQDGSGWLLPSGIWLTVGARHRRRASRCEYTRFGRHLFAIGSNERTARLCGVRDRPHARSPSTRWAPRSRRWPACCSSRSCRSAIRRSRSGLELDVIAAVIIGGGSLLGGRGSVVGTIAGAAIMTVIQIGCSQQGLPNWVQQIVTGAIIVVRGRARSLAPGSDGPHVSRSQFPRIATLKTAAAFRAHLERSSIPLAFDDQLAAPSATPFARSIEVDGVRVGNRFCILPMEGWDGTSEGEPSDLTRRRWRNFGISGAKLIWGGEAVAVRHDGRANPNQLVMSARTQPAIAAMREELVSAHRESFGANADGDLFVGLQLTHSGRYARPDIYDRPAPLAASAHPVLDRRFPNGVRVIDRRRTGRGSRRISRPRPASRTTPASRSSTSRRATVISATSCSAHALAPDATAARSRTGRGSCAR